MRPDTGTAQLPRAVATTVVAALARTPPMPADAHLPDVSRATSDRVAFRGGRG